jgi:plastocyanin
MHTVSFCGRWIGPTPALLGLVLSSAVTWWGCGRSAPQAPPPDLKVAEQIRGGAGAASSGDAAATPATSTGEGWGDLAGTFVFDGAIPQLGALATQGKDGAVCDAAPIPNQALIVDSATNGIKNIFVYVRKAPRVHESYADAAAGEVVFDQKQCLFLSHVTGVQVGQTLKILNSDPIGHNTNISPPADTGANVLLPGGGSADYKFSRQQDTPVAIQCNIHPWMKSYVLPRKDPYFAVTDPQGKFIIKQLPAGDEMEFQLWQESASGSPKGELVVPGLTDNKGRFKRTIPADGVLDLETITIPAAAFKL